ncbi:hypothetical protein [Actinomycetospora chiangmaiensis]|uniref:hypothetical protein n=1 Tax=Actinomycetospora chiangmaiensis TaxID=402650 RepID=UPI00036FA31D|nr:hypothetical protein [Actinomycetospora chiangmaiensis]
MGAMPMETRDDERRWEFYRTAMAAWVEAAGRAPVPSPREAPEEALRHVPR